LIALFLACRVAASSNKANSADTKSRAADLRRYGATRRRTFECVYRWLFHLESTRHVPAGPYAGVLATRWVVGAKPRGQCTESGSNGDRRTPSAFALSYGGTSGESSSVKGYGRMIW